MDKKQKVKKEEEDPTHYASDPNMLLADMLAQFGGGGGGEQKSSLGFMELLAIQDYNFNGSNTSIFDDILREEHHHSSLPIPQSDHHNHPAPADSISEVLNTPATPISSSVSSVSSGAKIVNPQQQQDEHNQHNKTKRQLKAKKMSQKKKEKEPRFAFMTKSEVDHLEDGYKWRKYGQKAVKNSPFPRGYYRCTSSTCNVKKRVERSFDDPSIVVTTYEGQHTHHSPVIMPRGINPAVPPPTSGFHLPVQMNMFAHYNGQLPQLNNNMAMPFNFGYNVMLNNGTNAVVDDHKGFGGADDPGILAFLRDNGLLQDIVPSIIGTGEDDNNDQQM